MTEIGLLVITWWFIWYNRNGVIFREESCSMGKVSSMICAYVDNLRTIGLCCLQLEGKFSNDKRKAFLPILKDKRRELIDWSPSEFGFVKINFDGSKLSNGQTTFDFIIRDESGS